MLSTEKKQVYVTVMVVASIEEENHFLRTGLASEDGEMLRASTRPLDLLIPE